MKVMIVVTHLLGSGHLARALTLGRAFRDAGDAVTVVSGGTPAPHFDAGGLRLVQLPPLRANGTDFSTLLGDDGAEASDAYRQARQDLLIATLADDAPDVLITELFPFGRRVLRDEFRALLAAAHAMDTRPLVLSSIRDILAPPSTPAKAEFAEEMVAQFYDGVLVHSDPEVVSLDRSWPVTDTLAHMLHYTGFVAPAPPTAMPGAHGLTLVSAGGGAVGDRLFEAAIDAAYLTPHLAWLFLVSGESERRARLIRKAPKHVSIERPRPDYRRLLQGAAASVSMCGYNTALDVMQTGVPSVLVPFDDGGEVEQGLRAAALSSQDGIEVLSQDALSGPALVMALEDVQGQRARRPRMSGMNGAVRSVEIARRMLADQRR
ncbi:glycosyltransferase [uncultured Tateyamaria sp.]|uniref:glycosyltransferase family protein n=1 Tax=uncultured Tateyamaria sp. TaxID=455651 RepID=UPI00261BD5B8|nr:glycosyltransferase [uncultured Tateyamaria sp.]